jgi:ABC-type uncharacterized transport system permease subunit
MIKTFTIGVLYGFGGINCFYNLNIAGVILMFLATSITYCLAVDAEKR